MHPLGWMLRFFLIALLGAATAEQVMSWLLPNVGDPEKGVTFRGSGNTDRNCRDDA